MKSALYFLLAVLIFSFGLSAGGEWIGFQDFSSERIIVEMRAMRLAAAFVTGGALALSGLIFQAILHNPLAEPFTLGLSGGAATGAALAFLTGAVLFNIHAVSLFAFAGALIVLAIVLLIARDSDSLLLSGVIMGTVASGVLMFLISTAQNTELAGITWWMLGNLQAPVQSILQGNGILLFAATALCCYFAGDLDALSLGRAHAWDLGVQERRLTLFLTVLASLLAAGTVALAGIIGFCGLVVPHVMKRLHGAGHRGLILPTVLAGGAFLMLCDTLCRLDPVREIPVGVITALIGGPFFLWVLNRKGGRHGA